MDIQFFKNQYALERMIVWPISSLEFNLRQFEIPQKKMIPENKFWVCHPKKGKSCKFTLWKNIPWDENVWKKSQPKEPLDLYLHTPARIKNRIVQLWSLFHILTIIGASFFEKFKTYDLKSPKLMVPYNISFFLGESQLALTMFRGDVHTHLVTQNVNLIL